MSRLLIKNATIVSVDPAIGDLPRGDILVEDDRIAGIAPAIAVDDAEIIDASGCIVAPGFVQAHIHTWQTAIRGVGGDWAGSDFFNFFHATLAPKYTPEDTFIGTLMGVLLQLDAGTTTVFDWCHNNSTPAHTDAAVDAVFLAGARTVFGHGTVKPKPKPGEKHFSQVPHPVSEIRRLRTGRFAGDDGLVTLAACILGPDYSTLDVCRHDFRMAREYGLLSSSHVWGRANRLVAGGYRTIHQEGLLGPDHNIVHGNYIEDDELRIIVDSGASVSSSAEVELKNHVRRPLSGRVRAFGGKPSIGIDSEVGGGGSMFEVMRVALHSERIFNNQDTARRIESEQDEAGADYAKRNLQTIGTGGSIIEKTSMPVREVLEWATINGARALRLDHRTGSLTPGKQADIIVVRRDTANMVCAHDPVQALVLYGQPTDVDTVLVAGKVMKRDGKLAFSGFEGRMEELKASAERLMSIA